MKYWQTTRFGSHLQAQHLDDLEDILNSPAPALDHPATTENLRTVCQDTTAQDPTTEPLPTSTPAAAQQVQSTALLSSSVQSHDASASNTQADVTGNACEKPSHVGQLSVWNTAYQSASAPIAAVWARLPEHLQRLKPQMDTQSSTGQSTRLPFLLEHMARNKGATAAATIAGAAAGGAIAGPLGIAAGAKSGAFMIAVGAAAAGAAQHYYSPIIARQGSAVCTQPSEPNGPDIPVSDICT
ncbi:MAG: hypothetical protein FRX49_11622 [Trebouxia sp. A1-2]|nr:MAG: hypothetical protein FRX49_11622 [Trebouxia sp. A1-2]